MHNQQRGLIGGGACENRVYHAHRFSQLIRDAPEVLSVSPQVANLSGLRVGRILTESIEDKAAEIADLMKERLGIRGKDLTEKLRHTGRMMPKRVKHEATLLVEALVLAENPKLSRMIDHERLAVAHQTCVAFLESVDVADRRKGVMLGILGSLVMALLVVAALVISVLKWRGYL